MDLYTDIVLDHYRHPRHYGELKKYSVRAYEENPLCGDLLTVDLDIDQDGTVRDIGFRGGGCAISQAAMSILTEVIVKKPVRTIKRFTVTKMLKLLEVPISPGRMKCATLGLVTVQKGLAHHSSKKLKNPLPVTKMK